MPALHPGQFASALRMSKGRDVYSCAAGSRLKVSDHAKTRKLVHEEMKLKHCAHFFNVRISEMG